MPELHIYQKKLKKGGMGNKHNNDSLKNKDSNNGKRRSPSVRLSAMITIMAGAVSIIMSIYCVYESFRLSSDSNTGNSILEKIALR